MKSGADSLKEQWRTRGMDNSKRMRKMKRDVGGSGRARPKPTDFPSERGMRDVRWRKEQWRKSEGGV